MPASKTTNNEQLTISGSISHILFQSVDACFCVFILDTGKDLHKVVGTSSFLVVGDFVRCTGRFEEHAKGKQFTASSILSNTPNTRLGIIKFLSSDRFPGIGQKFASLLVDACGVEFLSIIESNPSRLLGIPGVKKRKLEKLVKLWRDQKHSQDALLFLLTLGISHRIAQLVMRRFGPSSIAVVKRNPYILTDFSGVSFPMADKYAMALGLQRNSPFRLSAALKHCLNEAAGDGNSWMPQATLVSKASELCLVEPACITEVLNTILKEQKHVVSMQIQNDTAIALKTLYECEAGIADIIINKILQASLPKASTFSHCLAGLESAQREAVTMSAQSSVFILTGAAGTGKTTTCRSIIANFTALGKKVLLASPTGRAAARLQEVTKLQAKTIHRLLAYHPELLFQWNENRQLECDVLLLDEASISSADITHALLKALPLSCQLVFVGDPNQLASIGPGNVLLDLIESGVVPTVHLKEPHRQAKNSRIVVAAHDVINGISPKIRNHANDDLFMLRADTAADGVEIIVDLVTRRLPTHYKCDPEKDIQILSPMRSQDVGTDSLNMLLRERFHKHKPQISLAGTKYCTGERIIQVKNNYNHDIFNGDLAFITKISTEEQLFEAQFDSKQITLSASEMNDIEYSYAITIHKAQGSQFPFVIVPLFMSQQIMLTRNLLYVALTRATRATIFVGQQSAMDYAIRNICQLQRKTLLKHLILEQFKQTFINDCKHAS